MRVVSIPSGKSPRAWTRAVRLKAFFARNTISLIHVRSEDLIIYPNVEALRHPTPATAGVYAFNQPIDISASFGQDTKVLVSVFLKADYDQIGAGVSVFRPDQAKLDALSTLID